jgi:hypothetical protein
MPPDSAPASAAATFHLSTPATSMSSILAFLGLETTTVTAIVTTRRDARNGDGIKGIAVKAVDEVDPPGEKNVEPGEAGRLARWVPVVPPLAVLAAWLLSHLVYNLTIPCVGFTRDRACVGSLAVLRREIDGLSLAQGPILAAYDVSARFAWQSALVLFLAVAGLVSAIALYLAYGAMRESGTEDRAARGYVAAIGGAAGVVALGVFFASGDYLPLTDILTPLVTAAFKPQDHPLRIIETTQAIFRAAAFTASGIVVVAAGMALLHYRKGIRLERRDHLANQWRRLNNALFAGAALLVSAVLFQAAFFGWGRNLTEAVAKGLDQGNQATIARFNSARAALHSLQLPDTTAGRLQAAARDRLSTATTATDSAAIRSEILALQMAFDTAARKARSDSLTRAFERDTALARVSAVRVAAAAAQVEKVTTMAVTQAGGLVNSVLLLMMYLPAALILLERARELSFAEAEGADGKPVTEAQREQWRKDNGIAFSFASQWTKGLAVLAPTLASVPIAEAILKVFQS